MNNRFDTPAVSEKARVDQALRDRFPAVVEFAEVLDSFHSWEYCKIELDGMQKARPPQMSRHFDYQKSAEVLFNQALQNYSSNSLFFTVMRLGVQALNEAKGN
jgi:hypothetical protein